MNDKLHKWGNYLQGRSY